MAGVIGLKLVTLPGGWVKHSARVRTAGVWLQLQEVPHMGSGWGWDRLAEARSEDFIQEGKR